MPRIKDELITTKATGMLSNDFSIGDQAQTISGHFDGNDFTDPNSGRTVVIGIQPNQAGTGNASQVLLVTIKRNRYWPQQGLLIIKTFSDGACLLAGMLPSGQLFTALLQPGIQLIKISKPSTRGK